MGITDVYADRKKEQVMTDTWGHLYPETGVSYTGALVLATGGNQCILLDRDHLVLDYSPVEYELVTRVIDEFECDWHHCALWKLDVEMTFDADPKNSKLRVITATQVGRVHFEDEDGDGE